MERQRAESHDNARDAAALASLPAPEPDDEAAAEREGEAATDADDAEASAGGGADAEASAEGEAAAETESAEAESAAEAESTEGEAESAAEAESAEGEAAPTAESIAEQEQQEVWAQQRKRRWHERGWLRALAVVAVLGGIAAIIPYPLRVTSECTIIPSQRVKVRAEIAGVLSEILVDEGQAVKKGDVIARLDDRALKAERGKALADIAKIEAELATLRQGRRPEEIKQQEAVLAARHNEVEFAAKEAARRDEMAREGVGSRQAAEAATRELEGRRRAVAEAQAALQLLRAGSRPEEIAAHEAVLARARAELAYADEKLAMTTVRAPIDGEILTPRFRERMNEGVDAGGLVCEIANTRRVRAEIFVLERQADAIALGMPAIVKVESYPTHPFEGVVDFIAPAVDDSGGRLRVVVELENADRMLKANMTGYGEIEAGDRSLLHLATRRVVRWIRVRYLL